MMRLLWVLWLLLRRLQFAICNSDGCVVYSYPTPTVSKDFKHTQKKENNQCESSTCAWCEVLLRRMMVFFLRLRLVVVVVSVAAAAAVGVGGVGAVLELEVPAATLSSVK